jgi:hypothetical protein
MLDQEIVLGIASSGYSRYFGCKEKKNREFANCLHLVAIDLHCYLTCSMCNTSKQSSVFKKKIGQRKKHGIGIGEVCYSNFIYVLFIWCSLILCISCDFDIRVYLSVHYIWCTTFT